MKEYVNKTKQNMINHPRGTLDCSEVIFAEILFFRYLHEIYSSTIQNRGCIMFYHLHYRNSNIFNLSLSLSHVSPNKRNMRQQARLLLTYHESIELTIQKQFDDKCFGSDF